MSRVTSPPTESVDPQVLRAQAEQALRDGRVAEVVPLLEKLVHVAPDGSDVALFAHRNLAELQLQEDPWAAALHLRRVVTKSPQDHVAHALMGLCHALLGNLRFAVGSYRRAVALQPRNPWYNHNLGHLLDVALGKSAEGRSYLERAQQAKPDEDEISSSLGHCLARCGELKPALKLLERAVKMRPDNANHREILAWIQSSLGQGVSRQSATKLVDRMAEAGYPQALLDQARGVHEALSARAPRTQGDAVLAAIEYLVVRSRGRKGISQAAVARRHGVSSQSLSRRLREIEAVLRAG